MGVSTSLIPASAAVIGAALGLAGGELRWRRERRVARGSDFSKRRGDAYVDLWLVVEEAHIAARVAMDHFDADLVAELTLRVNSYLLRNGVFIDDSDRDLVDRYLRAVFTLVEAIRSTGDPDERRGLTSTMSGTSEAFARRVNEGAGALQDVDQLRSALRARVQRALGAEFVD